VYGTVKQHGGAIAVYSEVGKGTVFHVYIPLAENTEKEAAHETDEMMKGMGRILLMDDEESIRVIAKSILTKLGYEIVPAVNGKDAIEKFSASPDAFDLVILDMMTPEMNGRDCFLAMKSIKPDVRVILSSG
jgi:PleD family two-component response regulator